VLELRDEKAGDGHELHVGDVAGELVQHGDEVGLPGRFGLVLEKRDPIHPMPVHGSARVVFLGNAQLVREDAVARDGA